MCDRHKEQLPEGTLFRSWGKRDGEGSSGWALEGPFKTRLVPLHLPAGPGRERDSVTLAPLLPCPVMSRCAAFHSFVHSVGSRRCEQERVTPLQA